MNGSVSTPMNMVHRIEGGLLRAGRGFAGKLVQRSGEIVAGEVEERHEGRRQRAAIVEEVVDRMADVELVNGEDSGSWRSRRRPDSGGTGGGGVGIVVGGVGGIGSGTS